MANAMVEYDEKILSQVEIEEFVKQAGFKSLGEFKEIKIESQNKKEKVKSIFFTILAIVLMYISYVPCIYWRASHGNEFIF